MQEIDMFELFDIASGCDREKLPYSAGGFTILDSSFDEPKIIHSSDLENAVININATGGCAVITIDYPVSMISKWQNTYSILKEWLKDLNSSNKVNEYFYFMVIPYILNGEIEIIFSDLCFCDAYAMGNKRRLILGFDNNATNVLLDENSDFDNYVIEMKAELKRREEEVDVELLALEEEEKELNMKMYLHGVNDIYDLKPKLDTGEDKEIEKFNGNPNVRTSSDNNSQL